jgi:ATP-binding cassette subfamily B (MDR/TAP) protein 1
LDHVNFFFSAGETTFIVGRSGSGKSTIGNLLMLYYEAEGGEITVDGSPLQTLDINWLRNNITLVQQQSVLFNETLFRNIAFGRSRDHQQVKREEVRDCMRTAYLQHTVNELPKGLDTFVGTGGSTLSGGQRQRVAIARARLRDTPILIIDEGTSALDHISRTIVVDEIRQWRRGKTTIIITHDMSHIEKDDFVYVMDEGRIAQEGFRHALEKMPSGAFERLLQPDIYIAFPLSEDPPQPPTKSFDEAPVSPLSTRLSIDSLDSMEIQFRPRPHFIPSIFGPPPEDSRSRRASRGLISPLSPAAFPMHRMSFMAPAVMPKRRKTSHAIELLEPLPSPNTLLARRLTVDFSLNGLSAAMNRASVIRPASRRASAFSIRKASIASGGPSSGECKSEERQDPHRIAPIKEILYTVWPALTWKKRVVLVCGFVCAAIHAVATPMFSWVFAKLLGTFFLPPNERSRMALNWSLSVLGVAIGDSIASYYMHYLLEQCGQAWIDTLRVIAMKRILDQPREWFDRDMNSLTELTECLDRNAEEMRNLLGRFAAFVFVAFVMLTMAVVWSLVLCWKLTLVGLASAPFMYTITQMFETVSGKWEGKSNDAGAVASSIFTETFGSIRTVRALTLEAYFHEKYTRATDRAFRVGMKRSSLSGFFFGISESGIVFITGKQNRWKPTERNSYLAALIFYYGAVLASSKKFSVQDILTVFTMLLFSIANATNVIAFSESPLMLH